MKRFKLGLALCLAMGTPPAAASDYEYLNVAADQTVYFAKVGAQEGNTVALFMKWTAFGGKPTERADAKALQTKTTKHIGMHSSLSKLSMTQRVERREE